MKTINGKKPIEAKPTATSRYTNYQSNLLDIPGEIEKELKEKNLEGRWISYQRFVSDGNFHKEGWIPFKSEKASLQNGLHYGNSPDGTIRRKELVLATRPKEVCEAHRGFLKEKRERMAKSSAAHDLRNMARSGNFNTRVVDDSGSDE